MRHPSASPRHGVPGSGTRLAGSLGRGPVQVVSGVTRDSSNNPLAGCTVHLLRTRNDSEVDVTVSDGSGNYTFLTANGADNYYVVAYLAGSPDVSGTTLNTLSAVGG